MHKDENYIQFVHLKFQFCKFTHVFLAFSMIYINSYAYIIELSDKIFNKKALLNIWGVLQYLLINDGRLRLFENIEFFVSEEQKFCWKFTFANVLVFLICQIIYFEIKVKAYIKYWAFQCIACLWVGRVLR